MKKDLFYNGLTEERSGMIIFLGILSILCGCIGLINSYVGLILILFGLGAVSYRKAVMVDEERNSIQYYFNVLGFKSGQWERLQPDYNYILCRKHIESTITESRRWNPGVSKHTFYVVLLANENSRFNKLLFKSEREKTAREKAKELSLEFGLELKIKEEGVKESKSLSRLAKRNF